LLVIEVNVNRFFLSGYARPGTAVVQYRAHMMYVWYYVL